MAKKKDGNKILYIDDLSGYEVLIYGIMKSLESSGEKLTLENIHFKAVEYVLKFRPNFKGNTDTIKTLKKIALDDKTTGEWRLKSNLAWQPLDSY